MRRFLALAGVLLLALWPAVLLAQTAAPAPAPDTTVGLGGFWDTAQPYILTALSAAVTAIIGWVAAAFTRWTGIQIEARHREALHSAAMTGVSAALTKLGTSAHAARLDVKNRVVAEAIGWVHKSVPDAIAALGATPEALDRLIQSKLSLLAEAPSGVAPSLATPARA